MKQLILTLIMSIAAAILACSPTAHSKEIIHDAEHYILEAQHGERWAAEDAAIQSRLAELEKKHGTRPNLIHIMWDDTALGEIDLFTTLAGAAEHIPTDRIIDGVDQTSLFINGDGHSRRDYVMIYQGPDLAAGVKGRFKRDWKNNTPGLSLNEFYDLYTAPVDPKKLPFDPTEVSKQPLPFSGSDL